MKSELYSDEEISSIIAKQREGVKDTKLPLPKSAPGDDENPVPPPEPSEVISEN